MFNKVKIRKINAKIFDENIDIQKNSGVLTVTVTDSLRVSTLKNLFSISKHRIHTKVAIPKELISTNVS